MSTVVGIPYYDPNSKPTNINDAVMPGASISFFYTGTLNPAPVYADGALMNQLSTVNLVSDGTGQFPVIYLNPSITYRRQLFDQNGVLVPNGDIDPINSPQIGQVFAATKTAVTTRSSTSVAADPDLAILLLPGTYMYVASVTTASGGGLLIGMNQQGGTAVGPQVFTGSSISGGTGIVKASSGLGTLTWDTSTSGTDVLNIQGYVLVTSLTTVAVYWSCQTTGSTTMNANSSLIFTKIA